MHHTCKIYGCFSLAIILHVVLKQEQMYIFIVWFSPGMPLARKAINAFIYSKHDAMRSMIQGSCIMHHWSNFIWNWGVYYMVVHWAFELKAGDSSIISFLMSCLQTKHFAPHCLSPSRCINGHSWTVWECRLGMPGVTCEGQHTRIPASRRSVICWPRSPWTQLKSFLIVTQTPFRPLFTTP